MTLHLVNLHEGLGDVIACLWIIQAMSDDGHHVVFYTPKSDASLLWHEHSRPVQEAPEEAIIIYGRLNESTRALSGEHRLEIIRGRIPEDYRPATPTQPRIREEVAPLVTPPFFGNRWGQEVSNQWHRVVLLFPFSEWAHREWPLAHWQMLEARLEAAGAITLTLGLDANRESLALFRRCAWGLPLLQVLGSMRHAALTIANDSGPAHLAAALGTPLIRVHAMYAPEVIAYPGENPAYPSAPGCQGCCARPSAGYIPAICGTSCPQLASISPSDVMGLASRYLSPA